jgi:hypothetical protein
MDTTSFDQDIDFDKEYPLPKPSDTFLKPTGKKTLYTQSISGNWAVYTDSYRLAADRLVDGIEGFPYEDALICPVVFLYRHFVELTLKRIARDIKRLCGNAIPKKADTKHQLFDLWSYIRSNLKHANCDCELDRTTINTITRLIAELSDIDPDSMRFRYSHDKEGNEMPMPVSLDVQNLKDVMYGLRNALETLDTAIGLEQEWRAEESW